MRTHLLAACLLAAVFGSATAASAQTQSVKADGLGISSVPPSDVRFLNFIAYAQTSRPTTAKEFRNRIQDHCGGNPLRPHGVMGGDNIQNTNSQDRICAIIVLACAQCAAGKPTYIVGGVEGIVVGKLDMAVKDEMLTRGFGRLFRVMGELCGDYRFNAFAENFVKPTSEVKGDAFYLAGVFGAKEYAEEPGSDGKRQRLVGAVIPDRYFDPDTYRSKCRK